MPQSTLPVFFHPDVLGAKREDGLFEKGPSPLLAEQMAAPEGPERIVNIRSVLQRGPSAERFAWRDGRHATDAEILRFHTPAYLAQLAAWDAEGCWVSDTTCLPKGGMAAVRAAAGTALAGLEAVLAGDGPAYALVRPPGHHAAPAVADGYCFLNAAGMAAETALARDGIERVAIVDWDVHHGNGTQTGFYDRADVFVCSLHMDHGAWGETHPETGGVAETGSGPGAGYNLNLPLPMGSGDRVYGDLIERVVGPALAAFRPDLIIVANGHDAGQFDPNGRQCLTAEGFHRLAAQLAEAAGRLCGGRLLALQEGGYNPAHSAFLAYATAIGFLGRPLDLDDPLSFYPDDPDCAERTVAELIARHPLLDADGRWSPAG